MQDKILIIEDEERIARFVELELTHEGYVAHKAADGLEGLEKAVGGGYSLILLDVMLPHINGMEVLRRLRQHPPPAGDTPVIMLTARDATTDKVYGLDGGANDYVTKPFAIEELLARIRALLRKKSSALTCRGVSLDPERRTVSANGREIDLTRREFDLLRHLMENKDIVQRRETLLTRVWGYDYSGETNSVDVYIRYLRAKIEEPLGMKLIHTVRGVGYVVRD
ncbi:MAG: response regulator transcription factor [Oscillospiraceae bacterium]|nr:response regulator transcription factor [Oscillospiraceae bacterium]